MNPVLEAIKSRRSARVLKSEPIPEKQSVVEILEAGTWSPNHHLTEPWRFVVLAGEERLRLGEAMAAFVRRTARESDSSIDTYARMESLKPLRAPVIIAFICSPSQASNAVMQEEIVSCGAALQNMLLAAQSLGLGTMIKTGSSSYSDEVRDYFKMSQTETLIGLIYLGYVQEAPTAAKRSPVEDKTEWRGL